MEKRRLVLLIAAAVLMSVAAWLLVFGTGFLEELQGANAPQQESAPAAGKVSRPAEEPAPPLEKQFPLEKEMLVQIEGTEEKITGRLTSGKNESYIIYIDAERYKMVPGQEAVPDMIVPKEPLPAGFAEVSMAIEYTPGTSPAERTAELAGQLKASFPDLKEAAEVEEPVDGFILHGIADGGQQWDDAVITVYVASDGQQGSFTITERYFLEASEGHGARFYSMAREFKAVAPE